MVTKIYTFSDIVKGPYKCLPFSDFFAEVFLRYSKTHITFIDIEASKAQPYEEAY